MIRTSVTVPNIPKYSLNLSILVCQLSPPTNSLPGAGSVPELVAVGVDRPEDPDCEVVVVPFWHCVVTAQAICGGGCVEIGGDPLTTANAALVPFRGFIAMSAF